MRWFWLAILLGWSPACHAGGPPAGASSQAPGHEAGDAVGSGTDGGVGWVAASDGFPQWLTVDLGSIHDISAVRQSFAASGEWFYKIEGSNDDVTDDAWWTVLADHTAGVRGRSFSDAVAGSFRYVRLYITGAWAHTAGSVALRIAGKITPQSSATVPVPVPYSTGHYLVGAQACNLWANHMDWVTLVAFPARISDMLYYNEAFDVATDWQIKAAVEHGIAFMQPCWFRQAGNDGNSPVMASYDQFINSLSKSAKYRAMLRWDIDWINTAPGAGGVTGPQDFLANLVPFWISAYFSRLNYLKLGGKPVLAIYDFEAFIGQMGSLAAAQAAITSFRTAVRNAGYSGLYLLTQESRSTTPADHWVAQGDPAGIDVKFGNYYTHDYAHINADAAAAGFDAVFAYHIPTFTDLMVSPNPSDAQVVAEQSQAWQNWALYSAAPTIVTASVGWDATPWGEPEPSWMLSAGDWGALLNEAKAAVNERQGEGPSRLLLLDNWNEYAEGHYIAPTNSFGYSYLDATGNAMAVAWPNPVPASVDSAPDVTAIPQVVKDGASLITVPRTGGAERPAR